MKSQFLQPGQTGKPNGGLSLLELHGEVEVDQRLEVSRPFTVQTTLTLYMRCSGWGIPHPRTGSLPDPNAQFHLRILDQIRSGELILREACAVVGRISDIPLTSSGVL